MDKDKFDRGKPQINVGTIGDTNHGKTTLTAALTKVSADNGSGKLVSYDEVSKAANSQNRDETRVVSVATSYVEYSTTKRHYAHFDCPGHVDDIRNMIAGAKHLDAAILVISAVDGPTPQTREHVLLAHQLKVPYLVVALNKCDLVVDPELLDLVELEVRELLKSSGLPGLEIPIVKMSALRALHGDRSGVASVVKLMDALDAYVPLLLARGAER